MRMKPFYKMSSAALLFFGVLIATLFLQISHAQTSAATATNNEFRPSADFELESLDQVQEINEHNFKTFELHSSSDERNELSEHGE